MASDDETLRPSLGERNDGAAANRFLKLHPVPWPVDLRDAARQRSKAIREHLDRLDARIEAPEPWGVPQELACAAVTKYWATMMGRSPHWVARMLLLSALTEENFYREVRRAYCRRRLGVPLTSKEQSVLAEHDDWVTTTEGILTEQTQSGDPAAVKGVELFVALSAHDASYGDAARVIKNFGVSFPEYATLLPLDDVKRAIPLMTDTPGKRRTTKEAAKWEVLQQLMLTMGAEFEIKPLTLASDWRKWRAEQQIKFCATCKPPPNPIS